MTNDELRLPSAVKNDEWVKSEEMRKWGVNLAAFILLRQGYGAGPGTRQRWKGGKSITN
jgi:hypothetical protein